MSTFKAEVVKYQLEKHPNADSLSIAKIRGWNCVVKTEEFLDENLPEFYRGQNLGVYIPIDALADKSHPLLGFLEGKKVKTVRLRGVVSQGVLLPLHKVVGTYLLKKLPREGDDLTSVLNIKKWEEPVKPFGSRLGQMDSIVRPGWLSKYTDIENIKNYTNVILEGERVHISEKLHGTSAVYSLIGGKFFIASRNLCIRTEVMEVLTFKFKNRKLKRLLKALGLYRVFCKKDVLEPPKNWWTEAALQLKIKEKLIKMSQSLNTDTVAVYGEIVGPSVQDLGYGVPKDKLEFYVYDMRLKSKDPSLEFGEYLAPLKCMELAENVGFKTCPTLKIGEFSDTDLELRSGKSILADHVREGIVIKPLVPRSDSTLGRVILKVISEDYLLRKGAKDN